jgi:hypothetical protein
VAQDYRERDTADVPPTRSSGRRAKRASRAESGVWSLRLVRMKLLNRILNGNRIHYKIPEQAVPLLDELRRHKPDVMHLLRRQSFAHLLPFPGKRMWSPAGPENFWWLKITLPWVFEDGTKRRWCDPGQLLYVSTSDWPGFGSTN